MSQTIDSNWSSKLSIGVPLLAAAAGAWYLAAVTMQTYSMTGMDSSPVIIPIVKMANVFGSMDASMVSSFLLVWVVGMVAMMFPAMIPVMHFYSEMTKGEGKRFGTPRIVRLPLLLGGYLLVYSLLGLTLFVAVYAAFQLSSFFSWSSSLSVAAVVVILFLTGIWQLTPLKEKSLAKCVSPLGFFLTHGKKGLSGTFRMGAEHGVYCVGCCWLYMLVMLAVAAMSLISMALLSGLIVIEKAFVGRTLWFRWLSAGIFFSLATFVASFPALLMFF